MRENDSGDGTTQLGEYFLIDFRWASDYNVGIEFVPKAGVTMRKKPELLLAAAGLIVVAGVLLWSAAKPEPELPTVPPTAAVSVQALPGESGLPPATAAGAYENENPFEAQEPQTESAPPTGISADAQMATTPAELPVQTPAAQSLPPQSSAAAPPQVTYTNAPTTAASYPVHLNSANQAQLETLPGIGAVKAQRILEYRSMIGGFSDLSQLLEISGIGEKTLQNLLPYIVLN